MMIGEKLNMVSKQEMDQEKKEENIEQGSKTPLVQPHDQVWCLFTFWYQFQNFSCFLYN